MNRGKRFILFAIALLLTGGSVIALVCWHFRVSPQAASPTRQELLDFARQHKPELAREMLDAMARTNAVELINPTRRIRLAVGWLGLPDEISNQRLGDLVLADLSAAKNLELLDRQSLDAVLREAEMSLAGVVRAKSAMRVGKLLRADWLLLGSAAMINGSKEVVVRLVDARTGQSREIQSFPAGPDPLALAADLAAFVRQGRADASNPRSRNFLVIGEFRDLSANNPHAEFRQQLTAALTASFQGNTNVTLLEREQIEALLQELRLDLAGMTDEAARRSPMPAQWACWTVDGTYRFYENQGKDVELDLTVWQIFNQSWDTTLHGPAGEALFRQVKEAIDNRLAQAGPSLAPATRTSEINLQMTTGKQLCGINKIVLNNPGSVRRSFLQVDAAEQDRQTEGLDRAIHAFKTVLLLDPDNREAKMYLANCLWHPFIGRTEEACDYFLEVAKSPEADTGTERWKEVALMDAALCKPDSTDAADWIRQAQELTKTPGRSNEYELTWRQTEAAHGLVSPEQKLAWDTGEAERTLKERHSPHPLQGVSDFLQHFKSDPAEGLKRLALALPALEKKYPDMTPYLALASFVSQQDTNNPFRAEVEASLDQFAEHPGEVLSPGDYFANVDQAAYNWCYRRGQFSLAAHMSEAKRKASAASPEVGFTTADQLKLAYAWMNLERWKDALTVLENLPPPPVDPGDLGPWGHWTEAFLPGSIINFCRAKLGLPRDPNRLGNPVDKVVTFPVTSPFTCSDGSIWVAEGSELLQLDYNLATNRTVEIPTEGAWFNTVVCAGPSQIWIGTSRGGLIEYDKTTRRSLQMTGRNGLYQDKVSSLCLRGDTLWIGFGDQGEDRPLGGVGQLDLKTHQLSAFTYAEAPHRYVHGVAVNSSGQLFVSTAPIPPHAGTLLLHQVGEDAWQSVLEANVGMVVCDDRHVVVGLEGPRRYDAGNKYGLAVKTNNGPWQMLDAASGLPIPDVTAAVWDGADLWVGGWGYVALMDLEKLSVRKILFIHPQVDHIEIAGGFLWLQGGGLGGDSSLSRIPLSLARP